MSIKYAILGLLHYRDMYGYEIKRHIEQNAGFMWAINYGQIYPNLKQLKNEGFVTLKEVNEAGKKGPSRKLYSLTQRGREGFSQWLSDDPERFMLMRDPFFLRFMFFGFGDRSRALELIDDQIRHYEEQIERRRERMARWQKFDIYVRLLAELGVDFNQRILDWLKHARKEISCAEEDSTTASAARREEWKGR
jgi:PadR family transcriptional regulator, phenolic acid-responsive transcriptional regulator